MNSRRANDDYTLKDDVLLTKSGFAYLIGGNHSVLKYITGESEPTEQSLENFKFNISRRAYISKIAKCKFLHVIFPDKQSVIDDEFPIPIKSRLGDRYLEHIRQDGLQGLVVYPADFLKQTLGYRAYEKLDTHLSDLGSLVVLARILDLIGYPAPVALKEIQACINLNKVVTGDLGNKFSPPLKQNTAKLNPDWNHCKFSSNGSSNNGQIDIYFSPDSSTDKRVLIFGDSFFRLMLPHLSKIFRQVVFLRTPYYHAEMVELIRPDIVLTGNAERYLADVASDNNAPAFQTYSYTHNMASRPSSLFLNAFRSVTAPRAISSQKYFTQLFDDKAQEKRIIGPSHMVRWAQHVSNGLLKQPASHVNLIGFGGAPVWSQRLLETARKACNGDTKLLLMVGDFRFGNDIALKADRDSLPLFLPNVSGINGKAITPDHDQFMFQRSSSAILKWNEIFNNQIHFIFWDLFCRQVQDRLAGRHIQDKQYKHPHWNLKDVQASIPAPKLIDMLPLLELPMHEAMRLFIDPSSHPSHIGYLTIINCFYYSTDARTSFNKAVKEVESLILKTASQLVARKGSEITLFGQSVWLDTLLRYLGQSGLLKLESVGIHVITFNPQIGHVRTLTPGGDTTTKPTLPIYISDDAHEGRIPSHLFGHLNIQNADLIQRVAWEASCAHIIAKRNETPQSLHNKNYSFTEIKHTLELENGDIELGPYGYPTISGILKLLEKI